MLQIRVFSRLYIKYCFILLVLLSSCGTTGHIIFYQFEANKYDVEKEILNVINNSSHTLPTKWKDCNKGDYFEMTYVYFKNNPEEIYRLRFKYDSSIWNTSSTSTLALISQFDGDTWRNDDELSNKEIQRIQKRFETEILSKIKVPYFKSD